MIATLRILLWKDASCAGRGGCLDRVVVGERIDRLIIELARHAPHVPDRIGIATGLTTERLELCRQVAVFLCGQPWKFGLRAVATCPVTGAADRDRERLGVGLAAFVRDGRASMTTATTSPPMRSPTAWR